MGLELNNNLPIGSVGHSFSSNPLQYQAIVNKGTVGNYVTPGPSADYISKNSDLAGYLNEKAIKEMLNVNSEISQILKRLKITPKINMKILDDLAKNHLPHTKKITAGIVSHLPQEFRKAVEIQSLQKAAVLHDIGKVLIPSWIINKAGALTDNERAIMQKHSDLSYEMLKTTDLDEKTLDLVKNHHQNAQKTGYPQADENFIADINAQILSAADVYSALREKRVYKSAMEKNQALAIIHKDVEKGKLHPQVFKALVDWANQEEVVKSEKSANINPQRQSFYAKFVNCFSS